MKLDLHYVDPRLVALYDRDNPRGADTDFYIGLAAELNAQTIVDLGCGTGLLTRELAVGNRRVIGVDPAAAMLAYARHQPGAERVTWIEGDASTLGRPNADLAIMTGNVAQVFLTDEEWAATLRHLHTGLRPGGRVAFESRNPQARAWEQWIRSATYERIDSPFGPMECWLDLVGVTGSLVHFQAHNHFLDTGEQLVVDSQLRFCSQTELTTSLSEAGFVVEQVYGNWQRGPMNEKSRVMIFVARRK